MGEATFLDWSMRDPRALAVVALIFAAMFGPTIFRLYRGEREWRRLQRQRVDLGPERLTVDCDDCEGPPAGEPETCPKSKKPCGHHCNHSWSHEHCHYCGKEWGAE